MFQQVSLKRDGWHSRLQKWTFGSIPFKNNFCPFFWLTIFCIIVFPFVGAFKLARWFTISLAGWTVVVFMALGEGLNKLFDSIDKQVCQPWYDKRLESRASSMSEDDAYDLFSFIFGWYRGSAEINTVRWSSKFGKLNPKKRKKYLDQWKKWEAKWNSDEWKAKMAARREKLLKLEKERAEKAQEMERLRKEKAKKSAERAALRAKRHKQMMVALAKYTKFLVLLPIGIVAIYILYGLGLLTLLIMENWTPIAGGFSAIGSWLLWATPWLLGILLGVAAFGVLVYLFVRLIKKCVLWLPPIPRLNLPEMPWLSKLLAPFKAFGRGIADAFSKVIGGINSAVDFFVMYVKAFKENNCPAIDWEE